MKIKLLLFIFVLDPICTPYFLGSQPIPVKDCCKDLGVFFSSDLSWSWHIDNMISKAYRTLFLIKRTFPATSCVNVKKSLYLCLALPVLSYCSRPSHLKDIIALEKVQQRATKYIVNDSTVDYKARLSTLQMLPLMYRLELYDTMFFISSLSTAGDRDHFNICDYISFSSSTTHSGSLYKLKHCSSSTNQQRHSSFYRLPRLWNSLPPINRKLSFSCIKRTVLSTFTSHFCSHFVSDNPCSYHYLCPLNSCSLFPVSSFHSFN